MMFPYMSAYEYMMKPRRQPKTFWGGEPEYGQPVDSGSPLNTHGARPWTEALPEQDRSGFQGFGSTDPNSRKRAIYSGLLGAGLQLLEAAPRGDFAGGLARSAGAFAEGFAGSRDRDRQLAREQAEEQRRQAMDARQAEQERDRNESHDISVRQNNLQYDTFVQDQEREKINRQLKQDRATKIADQINQLAAANPDDAKLQIMSRRATGYLRGDDSDIDKLDKLYEDMTGQAFIDEDFDRATKLGIGRKKAEIDAGVEANPKAAEARANRALDLQAQGLEISRQNANTRAAGGTQKPPATALQRHKAIQDAARKSYNEWLASETESRGVPPIAGVRQAQYEKELLKAEEEFDKAMRFDVRGAYLGDYEE